MKMILTLMLALFSVVANAQSMTFEFKYATYKEVYEHCTVNKVQGNKIDADCHSVVYWVFNYTDPSGSEHGKHQIAKLNYFPCNTPQPAETVYRHCHLADFKNDVISYQCEAYAVDPNEPLEYGFPLLNCTGGPVPFDP